MEVILLENIIKLGNIGDKVISSETAEIKEGNCLPLKNIPIGTSVHNIELKIGAGGQLARSAGSSVQIVAKEDLYVQLRLVSGEIRLINKNCLATVGVVSNVDNKNTKLGKAGRKRYLGFRPKVNLEKGIKFYLDYFYSKK